MRRIHEVYFAVTTLEGPAWEIALHGKILPDEIAVKAIIPFAKRRLGQALDVLESVVSGRDYLVDDRFSVADIMIGDVLIWCSDLLDPHPALRAYVERLCQRPAYLRAKAVSAGRQKSAGVPGP